MSEHMEQVEVMRWAIRQGIKPWLIAIPNGGLRNARVAMRLKAEGVTAGFPDMAFFKPCGKYHGLFIELKTEKGSLQSNQKEWLKRLRDEGYCAYACRGHERAIQLIEDYLEATVKDTAGRYY